MPDLPFSVCHKKKNGNQSFLLCHMIEIAILMKIGEFDGLEEKLRRVACLYFADYINNQIKFNIVLRLYITDSLNPTSLIGRLQKLIVN